MLLYFPWPLRPHNSPPRILDPTVTNPTGISPISFLLPQVPCLTPALLVPFPHTGQTPSNLNARPLQPWSSHSHSHRHCHIQMPALSLPPLLSCAMVCNKGPEGDGRGDQGRLCEEKPTVWQGHCAACISSAPGLFREVQAKCPMAGRNHTLLSCPTNRHGVTEKNRALVSSSGSTSAV